MVIDLQTKLPDLLDSLEVPPYSPNYTIKVEYHAGYLQTTLIQPTGARYRRGGYFLDEEYRDLAYYDKMGLPKVERDRLMVRLSCRGTSDRHLATLFNVSRPTVTRILRENGL